MQTDKNNGKTGDNKGAEAKNTASTAQSQPFNKTKTDEKSNGSEPVYTQVETKNEEKPAAKTEQKTESKTEGQKDPESKKTDDTQKAETHYSYSEEDWDKMQKAFVTLRTKAEHMARRASEDIKKAKNYSIETFSKEICDVYDCMSSITEERLNKKNESKINESITEGIALTKRKLENTMVKHGIVKFKSKPGDAFDHEKQNAIAVEDHPDKANNTIVSTVNCGYMLNKKIIRHEMVIVNKTDGNVKNNKETSNE